MKSSFLIEGLDCAEEIGLLKKVFNKKRGIQHLAFDVLQGKMTVTFDPNAIDHAAILAAIKQTGMTGTLYDPTQDEQVSFWKRKGRLFLTVLSGLFLVMGFAFQFFSSKTSVSFFEPAHHTLSWPAAISYLLAIVCGAYFVFPKAFFSIKRFQLDMNVLMIVAIGGAIGIGHFFEGATVAFLFSVALLLEHWSIGRARRAIEALMHLSPLKAHVIGEKEVETRATDEVAVGTRILVRPGEKVPLDAVVVKGETAVNQAPLTGEALPISKREGDVVFAGSLNGDGAIECKTTKKAGETTLARMILLIEEARQKRGSAEKWVDRFAKIYTPLMMVFALGCALIPPLFFHLPWEEWFYRSLVILVIACPCALVISTPVSIVAGLTAAARKGLLIKGGIYLEMAGKLKVLAVDKTGTLTYGNPTVQKILPLNGHTEEELLVRAAALEMPSEHPLAKAILKKAKEHQIEVERATDFQVTRGKGAEGTFRGKRYWIGSHRFMHEMQQETPEIHSLAMKCEDEGHSVIAIGNGHHVCGLITVADAPRKNIRIILDEIKEAGVEKVVMLTGDHAPAAEAIAKHAGVDEVQAGLLPEEKVSAVEALKSKGAKVAMIGDGINDAPAMAAADFGVAMGAIGTDVAIETADVALMADDLRGMAFLIRHSKKTLKTIVQNSIFALAIKALFLSLAFLGKATLWMAIAADAGASLLVVFNSLRLLSVGCGCKAKKGELEPEAALE